jgi:hypothetical protein
MLKKCRKDVAFTGQLRTNTPHRKSLTSLIRLVNEFFQKKKFKDEKDEVGSDMKYESPSEVGGGNRLKRW